VDGGDSVNINTQPTPPSKEADDNMLGFELAQAMSQSDRVYLLDVTQSKRLRELDEWLDKLGAHS